MSKAIPIYFRTSTLYEFMTNYRRSWTPGSTFFFTVDLSDRRNDLLIEHLDLLREAFQAVMNADPFTIDAIAILPEHLHALWTLPPDDANYAMRSRLIKTRFSRAVPRNEVRSASRVAKQERGMWITSISIRSNMATSSALRIGRIRRFWECGTGFGLAAFVDSPLHRERRSAGGLGLHDGYSRCRRTKRSMEIRCSDRA